MRGSTAKASASAGGAAVEPAIIIGGGRIGQSLLEMGYVPPRCSV